MTEHAGAEAADDPVAALLLGFAAQIDQIAGLIGSTAFPGENEHGARVGELLGEVGDLVEELGDLLARLLSALIAVMEAVVEMLGSTTSAAPPPSARFQSIPVRITPVRSDP
ncbi:MAG: hypothetical protein QM809_11590 [Gordonia sp. (in: high G+C Gram-positive bacteria)]|uniref:hypothetical protein n=1 Tax=Gordonia sp. (in: high G+C Gram-positive bacteria) TaxID=84139 RepID=UPI0039E69209